MSTSRKTTQGPDRALPRWKWSSVSKDALLLGQVHPLVTEGKHGPGTNSQHRSRSVETCMALPAVSLRGLTVSRLIVGGNPFSGHAHQTAALSAEMLDYYTTAKIHDVLATCEQCGINTFLGRADAHIIRVLREYWNAGGTIQWIAQTAPEMASLESNIKHAADAGAAAIYLHGGWVDRCFEQDRLNEVAAGLEAIRRTGLPVGLAAHFPAYHLRAAERFEVDFQMVCMFTCRSLHYGGGEHFDQADVPAALDAIERLPSTCIAYKLLGAGRYDPREMLPLVYNRLKPGDLGLLGFYPKHHPRQVEETVALVEQILAAQPAAG